MITLWLACAGPGEPRPDPHLSFETGLDSEALDSTPRDSEEPPDSEPPDSEPPDEPCQGLKTYEGSPTLASWDELQDFGETYDRVEGHMRVEHLDGVRILSPLACLREVTGSLTIQDNEALVSLGLDRLETVGTIVVRDHEALETIELPVLRQVEDMGFNDNDVATELLLPELHTIEDDASIHNHLALTRVAMPSLASLGGTLTVRDSGRGIAELDLSSLVEADRLDLQDLPWTDLAQLGALERVDRVGLEDMQQLSSLAGLSAEVGTFSLSQLPALTSLQTLEASVTENLGLYTLGILDLQGISGRLAPEVSLYVYYDHQLGSVEGLEGGSLYRVILRDLPALSSLEGMQLEHVDYLSRVELPALESIGPVEDWASCGCAVSTRP